ncbi:MAG: hypothetical protein ILO36_05310 [Abditibacteriota bacterium]|nr:hypothetical protein [Abditibacteriota bacterium]
MKDQLIFSLLLSLLLANICFCDTWTVTGSMQNGSMQSIETEKIKSVRDVVTEEWYTNAINREDPYANQGWSITKYAIGDVDRLLANAHDEILERLEPVYLSEVPGEVRNMIRASGKGVHISSYKGIPDFIMGIYRNDRFYRSEIFSYNLDIGKSRLVEVNQKYGTKDDGLLYYRYMGSSYISELDDDIEKAVEKLPVVEKAVLHGRFKCILYDAARYAAKYYQHLLLTVVKDNGKIIWYDSGTELGDVAITPDGRYMISTAEGEFYVTVTDDRIISESYTPFERGFMNNMAGQSRWPFIPVSCRILTDNIVRLEYQDGCVEHWKVRLSEEDMEKNAIGWNEFYERSGNKRRLKRAYNHIIWSNEKGHGTGIAPLFNRRDNKKDVPDKETLLAWDYQGGGKEPVYDDMIDMSKMKNAPVLDTLPRQSSKPPVSGTVLRKPAAGPSTLQTGWLAGFVARVKSFFAGLFA